MKSVRKALIALVGTGIFAVANALSSDGKIDTGEWLAIAATILGSGALVYIATNVPGVFGGAIKAVAGAGGALVASLIAGYSPDSILTTSEILVALSAAITLLVGTYEVDDGPPPTA